MKVFYLLICRIKLITKLLENQRFLSKPINEENTYDIQELKHLKNENISKQLPSCRIVLSKPIIRLNDGKTNLAVRNINKHLSSLQSKCIENDNINS